jgi:glycopeptide antibiotics resistance protein
MTISATTVLVPALLLYLTLIVIPPVRRRVDLARRRPVALTILIGYGAAVVALTVFPIDVRPSSFWDEPWWSDLHWIPFYVDAPSMILNVIMFVPFGVLVPWLWPGTNTVRRVAGLALRSSAAIELTQLVLGLTLQNRRTVDVNDLMANTAGALLGLLVLRLGTPVRPGVRP